MLLNVLLVLIAGFLVTQAAILVTTIYLHRGLSHKGLVVKNPTALVFRSFLWLTTGMRPREWVAVHRSHHANADTVDDPHSPIVLGYWKVQLTNAALYRRTAKDGVTLTKYAKDLPADRWDRVLFDRGMVGLGVGIAVMCGAFALFTDHWWLGLFAAAWHMTAYIMLSGAINAYGHVRGHRPLDTTTATNNQWLAYITAGEGLHNNHHALATAAKFSFAKGQHDPAWGVIKSLSTVGQISVRHDPAKVAATV